MKKIYSFRKSTEQKSGDLQLKLEKRESEKELRKAKKLSQETPVGAAEEVSDSETSEEETSFSEPPTPILDTSKSSVNEEEEEEYWYDTSGDNLYADTDSIAVYPEESDNSFVHSPSTPLSPANLLTSNQWSKSNLFFPEDSIPSPPYNSVLNKFEATLRSIEEKSEEGGSVEDNSKEDSSVEENSEEDGSVKGFTMPDPEPQPQAMASDAFETKFKKLKDLSITIELSVLRLNEETVTAEDLDTYKDDLNEIFKTFVVLGRETGEVKEELNETVDEEKLGKVDTLFKQVQNKVLLNEKKVKAKIGTLRQSSNSAKCEEDTKKVTLKINNATAKFVELQAVVDKVTEVDELSEIEISEFVTS